MQTTTPTSHQRYFTYNVNVKIHIVDFVVKDSIIMHTEPTNIAPVEDIAAHLRDGAVVLDVRNPDELVKLGNAVSGA